MNDKRATMAGRFRGIRLAGLGLVVVGLLISLPTCAEMLSPDIFNVQRGVPQYGDGVITPGASCTDVPSSSVLSFRDALDRALCHDPKVRGAWQDIKVRAAQLGQAKAAFLPTVSADYQAIRDNSKTDVHDHPTLSSSNHALIQTADISANLVLWDFGSRAAASRAARELMLASAESYRAALQTAYATVAKDYYATLGAAGAAVAMKDAMLAAKGTATAARARVEHGASAISDQLQAETSYQQAIYDSQKADSDLRAAKGILAIDMGQDPTLPYSLPDITEAQQLSGTADSSIKEMLEEATDTDPSIASALAQLNAAQAQADKIRADGLPTLSLTSKYTRNNQPASLGLGVPQYPASGRDSYVGIQVRIPIFEGFTRAYQISEARAKVAEQEESVRDARKQVAAGVWTDYESVTANEENMLSTERLMEVAERSFDAASHRYQVGAGSILEVLNAQTALARAQKQRVSSLADFATATLQLAAKLGRLQDR